MKQFIYLFGLGLLLTACSGESNTTTTNSDTTKTDTLALLPNIDIDVNSLLSKFTVSVNEPFIQDTLYLAEKVSMSDTTALAIDEIKYLSYNYIENEMSFSGKSSIDDAMFFDSLKANNEYEGYVEVIDIGMMKDAKAYVAQKVVLDETTTLLLWFVDYGTYEACPYSSGKTLYASVFQNNEVKSCTLIGEDSSSGDAPYWSSDMILVSITKDKITALKKDSNGGDTDEEGNEITFESSTEYELTIDENGVWVVTAVEAVEV